MLDFFDVHSKTRLAFRASIPVFFGYFPLGLTFGILMASIGCTAFDSFLSGFLVLAGAAQFLSVGLLAKRVPVAEVFLTILFLNFRHVFYGISLVGRMNGPLARRLYMIFGLTDETYSVLTASGRVGDSEFGVYLTLFDHAYWVIGCTLGGWIGSAIRFDTKGFEFVLTALFVVLTIEQARVVRRASPFFLATGAALVAKGFFPGQFLAVSLLLVLAGLLVQSGRAPSEEVGDE